ncbi:MAG: aspartate kinase [Polyangiales bacterium]
MTLIVQKYGGTSVGSIERIRAVADKVSAARAQGHDVVVVVSAMSGETNRLLGLGKELAKRPDAREMDSLVATGEQVTAALLSIALMDRGIKAHSLVGAQTRIRTDGVFTKARIQSIDVAPFRAAIDQGSVAVVAGFQGTDLHGNITTLGRGGSDTTGVAVAAALKADVCEIYTDVEGIYTTDPNVCKEAKKLQRVTFEEMLELASLGAKVLQLRSVEIAMKYGIPIHLRSSFKDVPGTIVGADDDSFESVVVTGIASDKNEVKVTMRDLPNKPGTVARVFGSLAEVNISVDMIIQTESRGDRADLTFTVTQTDLAHTRDVTERVSKEIGAGAVELADNVAKVSIVGAGMRSHAGVAAKMFKLLADQSINIQCITTSEIRVSCLIDKQLTDQAVRTLHQGFGLG